MLVLYLVELELLLALRPVLSEIHFVVWPMAMELRPAVKVRKLHVYNCTEVTPRQISKSLYVQPQRCTSFFKISLYQHET